MLAVNLGEVAVNLGEEPGKRKFWTRVVTISVTDKCN